MEPTGPTVAAGAIDMFMPSTSVEVLCHSRRLIAAAYVPLRSLVGSVIPPPATGVGNHIFTAYVHRLAAPEIAVADSRVTRTDLVGARSNACACANLIPAALAVATR